MRTAVLLTMMSVVLVLSGCDEAPRDASVPSGSAKGAPTAMMSVARSEEHTSELQSPM